MKKKTLVTGADGFIGSHLVEKLIRSGESVKAFTYYNSFNTWGWLDSLPKEILNEIEVFSGDVRDPFGVHQSMEGCDKVFHLAALIAIPYSYHSPSTYIDTNINGTLNILQSAKQRNIEKIIHTSTSEVYGTARFVPITEEHPLQGQSPYSASKIGADQIAYSYFCSFQTPVTIVRPFNTYGPRQSARAVIPTIITQIASGKKSIQLGSLTPTRDFNYVDDTTSGFIAAMESANTDGQTINIGSNFEISIEETAKLIADVMGETIEFTEDIKRIRPKNSEVERLYSSNDKARKLLKWSPEYAGVHGFKKGLSKTIDWFTDKSNLKLYKTDIYNI